MNFDLDDPLGDILSDGSNDSFFETTKKPAYKPTRVPKSSTPIKDSNKKMADLFGFKNEEQKFSNLSKSTPFETPPPSKSAGPSSIGTFKPKEETRKIESPLKQPPSLKSTIQTKRETFDDDNNDIDLGFDLKKIKSKSGILDDLLGIESSPATKPQSRPKTTSNSPAIVPRKENQPAPLKPISIIQPDSTGLGSYAPTAGRPRIGRRSSINLPDPLGLFTSDDAEPKKIESRKTESSTDWLGLDTTKEKTEPSHQIEEPKLNSQITMPSFQGTQSIAPANIQPISIPMTNALQFKSDPMQSAQILSISNRETETVMQEMRQQELQVMYAIQIKNQESVLYEMQKRQQELIAQQEIQFNELIRNQLQRQEMLESNIKQQQDRINAHIQILLAQPQHITHSTAGNNIQHATTIHENQNKSTHDLELESELKRIEMEKIRMEDTISNINANHEQEIVLLEQSYKNQIRFLTESNQNIELRLKDENKVLHETWLKKLGALEGESRVIKDEFEKKYREMENEHDRVVKKLKEIHSQEIDEMRKENKSMIENIRESKMMEFAMVQENGSYLETLKSASKYLENASGDIETLRGHMTEKINEMHNERQMQLEIREKAVEQQQKRVERSQELADEEKKRLLELVKTLEVKLNAVKQTAAEEDWTLKQKIISLETDKIAFEREREFYREQHDREQKNFDEMKRIQNADYERRMRQFEEAQSELLIEKAKIETMARVQPASNTESSRVEIEAAIKIAQDAARQADEERERLFENQRRFETKKRELIDKEQALREKEANLDSAINAAKAKERHAKHIYKSAQNAEQKFRTKLQLLHRHANDLALRESTLSKEKLDISRERVELQSLRKRLYKTRCSLCKIGEKSQELSQILSKNENNPESDDENQRRGGEYLHSFDINRLDRILDNEVEQSMQRMNEMRSFDVDVEALPNITDVDDELLDPQLLMLKLDAINGGRLNN